MVRSIRPLATREGSDCRWRIQRLRVVLVLQPDGKLVACGYSSNGSDDDFAVVRYNADGSLDPSFGNGGKVTTAVGSYYDRAWAVVLQPDGKIVAAGESWGGSSYD